jgi:sterol 3beta-glucosyltransferase
MLRNNLPVIIISFYTDQPTWGKIIERMQLGVHVPVKKLTSAKLLDAIVYVQTDGVKRKVTAVGRQMREENGVENAVNEIERYFGEK